MLAVALPLAQGLQLAPEDKAYQELRRKAEAEAPIRPPLTKEAVEGTLERRVLQTVRQLRHPIVQQEIDADRSSLRSRLTESLGYRRLPWPPNLRATALGTLSRTGYHIEKLGYQTLPNVLVPAHVYVPDGLRTAAPAIIVIIGGREWKDGKTAPDGQTFAINMAKRGFVVMVPDPIGAGERASGEKDLSHREALLVGLSQAGIVEYETQCALEYLIARKDVDPSKIGITGVDGGGFAAWLTAALDDHIAAALPVDDTFDFADVIHAMRGSDWNDLNPGILVPGILQYANTHELIALIAPRPVLIVASPDARPLYEYGQRLYGAFGAVDRIRMFDASHSGYERSRRQAAYGFFEWALLNRGDGSPAEEQQTQVEPSDSSELACLPAGQRASSDGGIAGEIAVLAALSDNMGPELPLRVLAGAAPQPGKLALGINTFPVHRLNLATEEGIEAPVTILRPGPGFGGGNAGTLLAIDDKDKESLASDPIVEEALRRDYLVVEMDPRGFGELAVSHPAWVSATSLLLGENFVWRQARDIQLLLNGLYFRAGALRAVYARGPYSSLAASYAIWLTHSQDLVWAVLRGSYTSVRQFLESPARLPVDYFAFGALRSLDIPQMLADVSTKTLLIDPVDPARAGTSQSARIRVTTVQQFLSDAW